MRFLVFLAVLVAAGVGAWFERELIVPIIAARLPSAAPLLTQWTGVRVAARPAPTEAPANRPQPQAVPVVVAAVERKAVPVAFEAVGTVQAIASIPLKARVDSQITEVHVSEGAKVSAGDLLFTLDSRTLVAQLAQADAQVQRDIAQLAQARRDLARAENLLTQKVTSEVTRDTAATAVKVQEATLAADTANRENLAAQLSYTEIRSPVSGRIGSIPAKIGTFVRQADTAPLATVNQMDPIYVVFSVPQARLPGLRAAIASGNAAVEVNTPHGSSTGTIAFIENAIDPATGTVPIKASMPNGEEDLWPGAFVTVRIILERQNDAVAVPTAAVQMGQRGAYVFVVQNGTSVKLRPVQLARTVGSDAVIASGLEPGEQVVTDGVLRLVDGAHVTVGQAPVANGEGAPAPPKPAS